MLFKNIRAGLLIVSLVAPCFTHSISQLIAGAHISDYDDDGEDEAQ